MSETYGTIIIGNPESKGEPVTIEVPDLNNFTPIGWSHELLNNPVTIFYSDGSSVSLGWIPCKDTTSPYGLPLKIDLPGVNAPDWIEEEGEPDEQ